MVSGIRFKSSGSNYAWSKNELSSGLLVFGSGQTGMLWLHTVSMIWRILFSKRLARECSSTNVIVS